MRNLIKTIIRSLDDAQFTLTNKWVKYTDEKNERMVNHLNEDLKEVSEAFSFIKGINLDKIEYYQVEFERFIDRFGKYEHKAKSGNYELKKVLNAWKSLLEDVEYYQVRVKTLKDVGIKVIDYKEVEKLIDNIEWEISCTESEM